MLRCWRRLTRAAVSLEGKATDVCSLKSPGYQLVVTPTSMVSSAAEAVAVTAPAASSNSHQSASSNVDGRQSGGEPWQEVLFSSTKYELSVGCGVVI